MSKSVLKIAGVGCALADYLYTKVDFNSPSFRHFQSQQSGDGGLSPGKLVFTEELEKFASESYRSVLSKLIGNSGYDSVNIGGPALVSLIHAAQLLPSDAFSVSYYGCVGDDETGQLLLEKVSATPLDTTNYLILKDKKTAFTDVLSDRHYDNGNGERTFINNIGASWDYSPAMLPESFFEADIVCFGGTALVPQIHDNLTELLLKAKSRGCTTVVNTVFDFRNEKNNPNACWPLVRTPEAYDLIDILLMDCEEALRISGTKTIDEAATFFSQQKLSSFIITNGCNKLYAYSGGELFEAMEPTSFPVSELVSNRLKINSFEKGDTTGCGDNFTGGVIASMALQLKQNPFGKYDLIDALSWGVASGGFACFYVGGTYFESSEGEKLNRIKPIQHAYLDQIRTCQKKN